MTTTELPRHPVTGLRALGRLPSGRPVWPVMGGDGNGDGGDGQGGQAGAGQQNGGQQGAGGDGGNNGQQGTGQGQQNNGNQQGQQGGQEPPVGPDGQPWDPARAQALIENLRAENQRLKQRGDGQGGNGGQQQAAGQQGQGQAPGQQQNQGQQNQSQQQAGQAPADHQTAEQLRATQTELAVYRHASTHGANPAALTDSKSFMDKLGKLDPAADDYTKQVNELIKKTLTDHPHYATSQVPGRSGGDFSGGPGKQTATPKTVDDFRKARREWRGSGK